MATLATDNFNRANANPMSGSWGTVSGEASNLQITTNTVTFTLTGSDASMYSTAVTWPADQYSQLTCTVGTSAGAGFGPTIRQASGALTRYRLVVSRAASVNMVLAKQVAGSYTEIWARTSTFSSGTVARLEAQGTTIRGYNAGVQIGADATDSAIASGNAGICYSSSDSTAVGDNWEGGNLVAAAGYFPDTPSPGLPVAILVQ